MAGLPDLTSLSLGASALAYARAGWRVFPVAKLGKTPLGNSCETPGCPGHPEGFKAATTDPETVETWWKAHPSANIGLRPDPDVWVLDLDAPKQEGGKSGEEALQAPEEWPATLVARTGGGGRHLFFRVPPGWKVKATQGALADGCDTRQEDSFVVVAPSLHSSGRRYKWAPDAAAIAETPQWLFDRLREKGVAVEKAPPPIDRIEPGCGMSRLPRAGYAEAVLEGEAAKVASAPEGQRNGTLNNSAFRAGQLVASGIVDETEAKQRLGAAAKKAGLSDREIDGTIESGLKGGKQHPRAPVDLSARRSTARRSAAALAPVEAVEAVGDRVELLIEEPRYNQALREAAGLLRDQVFLRGPAPSVLIRAENVSAQVRGVDHAPEALLLVQPTRELVSFRLNESATFTRPGRPPQRCPRGFAQDIIGAATQLPFRQLAGVVLVPLFRDGEIVTRQGYDETSRCLLAFKGTLPAILTHPTKQDAEEALKVLMEPFDGYTHKAAPAGLRSAIAAAVLTAVLRPSLPSAPAVLIDGALPGVGKGLMGWAIAVIATGHGPSVVTEGPTPDETEKRITAAILSGAPVLLLDNLQRSLASSALESGLTEGTATIRKFGSLDSIEVPVRSLVVVTANNATLRSDMLRRTLPVRIVPTSDTPEDQVFTFDPVEVASKKRMEIVHACMTIARAWWQARDTPEAKKIRETTLGSFDTWAKDVGGAVDWLTGTHPVTLIRQAKQADGSQLSERAVIEALHAKFGEADFLAKDAAVGIDPDRWEAVLRPGSVKRFMVTEAPTGDPEASKQAPTEGARVNRQAVGLWLKARRDRFFGELQLQPGAIDSHEKVQRWRVKKAC